MGDFKGNSAIKLTTNLSGPLLALLHDHDAPIDGIEVGPWISPRKIIESRSSFPSVPRGNPPGTNGMDARFEHAGMTLPPSARHNNASRIPFYFHGGNIINGVSVVPGTLRRIKRYLEVTASPWLSLHITFLVPGVVKIFRKRNWKFPSINPDRGTRGFIQKVQKLASRVNVPILLENPDPIPLYENHEIQTDRINQILDATHSRLLLDIGHARLSAETLGMAAEEYILKLPLDRLDQVHVSGPRMRDGRLFDAHEPLREVDYALLDFVLARSTPKVLTLEYVRRIDPLREQLNRLRGIIHDRKAKNQSDTGEPAVV
jgi:uncharacterized protein (UPF0276 family)